MWFDLVQEEIRRNTRGGVSTRTDDEDNFSLVGKGKEPKGNNAQGKTKLSYNGDKKKKDDINIKYFHCHELDHLLEIFLSRSPRRSP